MSLVPAVAVAFSLVLAGCGGNGSDDGDGQGAPVVTDDPAYEQIRALLPDRIRDSGTITVSNPLQNPPYAFELEDGTTLKGIAPDLSKALEPVLGVRFEWVDTPFPGLIPGLQTNKFDMIWGSITDTEEREEVLDFVTYHMDGALLLVEQGNPEGIGGIEDTCGKSISALKGSVQIELLEAQSATCVDGGQDEVDVRIYPDVPRAELSVRSRQTAAFFAGVGAARYQAQVAADTFETAGPIYDAAPFGAGFRKDDPLAQAIQAGLKALVEDGAYEEILDEYGMGVTALTADQIMVNGASELSRDELVLDGES